MSDPIKSDRASDAAPCSASCPQCHGFKRILTFHGQDLGECEMCEGTGKASDEKMRWYSYGQRIKAARLDARMTLRKAAVLHGIDPSNLSKMERGIICPRPLVYPQNAHVEARP